MKITATVRNSSQAHEVVVATDGAVQALDIAAKVGANGSAVNGGEFLMLALATCYCNDLYREAARLNVHIEGVVVEASADFTGRGIAATNIRYHVAEVHNTLRQGVQVQLD